jgi:hypothetical protein
MMCLLCLVFCLVVYYSDAAAVAMKDTTHVSDDLCGLLRSM